VNILLVDICDYQWLLVDILLVVVINVIIFVSILLMVIGGYFIGVY
jgi:hypothetical protein